jgi:1-acyl-sn-glycerol-3-phosphate acyltransferase
MRYNWYRFAAGLVRILLTPFYWPRVHREERMPQEGWVIVCGNHQSMLDPVFLGIYTERPIRFMAKDQLFSFKPLAWILRKVGVFPVHREGTDIRALKTALSILKEEDVLGIFPEGTRVDTIDIRNFKEGVSVIAMRAKADIVPVRIHATYKLFSRVDVHFREVIKTREVTAGLAKEEAVQALTRAVFESIYEEEVHGNHHR